MSIQYNNVLRKVYKEEHIIENLSALLNTDIRTDWIGRLYTVINPYIKDGKYDPESQIFELGNDQPLDVVVERYIMTVLNISKNYIKASNLFDILTYEIRPLDDKANFLFMMYPIPYINLKKYTKRLLWLLLIIAVVGISLIFIL